MKDTQRESDFDKKELIEREERRKAVPLMTKLEMIILGEASQTEQDGRRRTSLTRETHSVTPTHSPVTRRQARRPGGQPCGGCGGGGGGGRSARLGWQVPAVICGI